MTNEQKEAYESIAKQLGVELPPLGNATCEEILSLSEKGHELQRQATSYLAAFSMQMDVRNGE